jgi:glutamine synthetase
MTTPSDVLKIIKEKEIKYVDFRFCDTRGKEQHVTVPSHQVKEVLFTDGKMFDGSSIAGWKGINESDMILMPDAATAILDPFFEQPTLNIRCDVIEPPRCRATSAIRARSASAPRRTSSPPASPTARCSARERVLHLRQRALAQPRCNSTGYEIDSYRAPGTEHRVSDRQQGPSPGREGRLLSRCRRSMRTRTSATRCAMRWRRWASSSKCTTTKWPPAASARSASAPAAWSRRPTRCRSSSTPCRTWRTSYGKTATFMPKPLVGDNGSGMHVHQSLQKDGKALFAGDKYGGLSETALYYIGGIIKHAKAINAFTNAGTNSYKRLVPGFEAPVMLAYSARNRSASIRIPWVANPKARRIEVRFPDSLGEPVPRVRGDDDGRPRRHPEQDPPRRPGGQGSVRPGARGGEAHPDGVPLARHGARAPRQGSRVPEGRRRVHGRRDRRLHRAEDAGSHALPHEHASVRARHVLQPTRYSMPSGPCG